MSRLKTSVVDSTNSHRRRGFEPYGLQAVEDDLLDVLGDGDADETPDVGLDHVASRPERPYV